ncbi:probable cyclin-dependent serine/threonine-protein kinase DDB_G0292550 isoform X2 [Folsomia candida]|uniref:probable cyclin-dependent serine/threonine-protein kinase DDB_G0292550 isoform X2 n=1 Tax=Folsomia candida TaxID=158441 RepID=UPI000B8F7FE1|nr:probable cyclin-dependent serine/threonine-protein kinase DDB_G0292550 isoform X2 [Folsomia candida]
MQIQVLLLSMMLAISTSSPSPSPPPRAGYYPSSSPRPVYMAQRSRDYPTQASSEDDEPYPSTSSLGTARTTNGAEEAEDNTGFVEPIDFKNLLQDVDSTSKGLELGANNNNNPLFASESKNSFAGFFGSDNKDPFADFGGGGLAAASSERSTKNPDDRESTGFVDPNVNFRSLFDSSQTASNGFTPQDFLGSQGDGNGARGSQTRAFPSFTYSGRKEDGPPNRFRSNYRQVDSQDDDYSSNNRGRDDDDRDYEDSPRGRPRYSNNSPTPRYSPNTEESSHRPQSTGRGGGVSASPKAAESKNNPKCKKVEKTVDYENEDYAGFTEPEPDYDPSTYRGRYKRQSRPRQGRQAKAKRPMTCYVCEDEQGRYAERCSYDSKANPNKNEYFHSSSSSFSDNGNNGRRPSGKQDRHRRNPSINRRRFDVASTTLATVSLPAPKSVDVANEPKKSSEIEEAEPKVVEKRQSGPDRYASNFGSNGPRNNARNNNRNNDFDYNGPAQNGADFGLPRGYIGAREEENDSPQYQPQGGGRGNDYGFDGANDGSNNDDRDFGFGGRDSSSSNNNNNDFNFGPPADFGRESAPSGGGGSDRGFNFDFSIPKEYDPDVQLRNSNRNSNRQGGFDGGSDATSNRGDAPTNFDAEYDDYVKKNFPDAFGPSSASSYPEASTRPSSSSFRPSAGPPLPSYQPRPRGPDRDHSFNQFHQPESSPPRGRGNNHRGNPDKEHTQPSYNFAPPPNFYNDSPQGGFHGDVQDNAQNLNKLVENFSERDRAGCQRVLKGDMSCFVCRDARGMNKEECMYSSNDPKNQRMAYHEVTEYSSDPPASILPLPQNHEIAEQPQTSQAASEISSKTVASPHSTPSNATSLHNKVKSDTKSSTPKSKSVTRVESTVVTRKIHHENNTPFEYDFDY